ncbi:hypothetical protein J4G33_02240 [Actinotalea sp. BY-33]|uniref:non-specific serine/threonine protein kinase n=1 Tax=Actinotalea soli TaxID=2819234 RepID=A0A939LNK3_9CELL|nr:hypothetical protein [Actinotalea soli]MBO1750618.1 hypothetical protein [Actinotalea soli]
MITSVPLEPGRPVPGAARTSAPGACAVPPELPVRLAEHGLVLLGAGPAPERGWRARDLDGRTLVVSLLRVGSEGRAARARERVERLRAVDSSHVATVRTAVEIAPGLLAVPYEEVPGVDLRRLRGQRGRWSVGEVVSVVAPLAEAVAAMHRRGLVHGDVSPGNVVITPDGSPVLIDLLSGADPEEEGTPGFVAPERVHGAGPAGDVHALALIGLQLLAIDELDTQGAPPDPWAAARGSLVEVLRQATTQDPAGRPAPGDLARRIVEVAPASPVRPRVLLADTPAGAGTAVEETVRRERAVRGRHRRPGRLRTPALGATLVGCLMVCSIVVGASAARDEEMVTGSGAQAVPGAATTAGAVLGAGAPTDQGAGAVGDGGEGAVSTPASGPQTSVPRGPVVVDPVGAAVELTQRRVAALAEGDTRALAMVTVPGSPASEADARTYSGLAAAGIFDGEGRLDAEVEVMAAHPAPSCCAGDGRTAQVRVRARTVTAGAVPGSVEPTTVVLRLQRSAAGWRVSEVLAGA